MASTYSTRLVGLDVFRGWAIMMMMVFHLFYDLALFDFVHLSVIHDPFWVYFRYVIVSMFLLSVGISLGMVHGRGIRWDKVARRALILGVASIVVTVATRVQSPHAWVYFGILHLIFVASFVGLFFVRVPRTALIMAALVLWGSHTGWLLEWQHQLFLSAYHPLHLPRNTEDLARFFPWIAAVLIGVGASGMGWHRVFFSWSIFTSQHRLNGVLSVMGRHALVVYLIHLPLLFGIVMGTHFFMHRG